MISVIKLDQEKIDQSGVLNLSILGEDLKIIVGCA
jgi:hypothetical protein